MKEILDPIPVTCHKCGYVWDTRTSMFLVTCPKCGARVKVIR